MEHTPSPFRLAAQRTEAERRTTADKFKTSYDQRGEPMGKTDKPNNSLPLIPQEQPKPTEPHHPVFGTKLETKATEAPVKLSDVLDGLSTEEFNASESKSPDEQNSHMAEPPRDDAPADAVKTGEPPHWTHVDAQMKMFNDFITGQIDDYGLFDRDERGDLKDWTVSDYCYTHKIEAAQFNTYTEARDAADAVMVKDFGSDLAAICKEKGYPKELSNAESLIGMKIKDALQKMTGKGIRAAVTSKIAAWENEKHIEQANASMQRNLDEQKAAAQPAPVEDAVMVDEPKPPSDVAVVPPPQKPAALTVIKPAATLPYWQGAAWQVDPFQMADMVAKSNLYKGIDTAAKAFVVMMKGVELGISPMSAFGFIHLIPGSAPAPSGAFMLGMLRKNGVKVEFVERTETRATVRMSRVDTGESATVTWTIEQARKAGLISDRSPAWNKYPIAMLTWRAVGDCARLIGTDILAYGGLSLYLREEIDETMTNVEEAA